MTLVIERLPDWSYGAFLNETDASCIAIGMTEEEARTNGEAALTRQRNSTVIYGELARPQNE